MKRLALACAAALAVAMSAVPAGFPQAGVGDGEKAAPTDYSKWSPQALEAELNRRAVIQRKVRMPMRDGVNLSTDIYRPKDVTGPVPTIFVRTPYNMNTLQGGS